MLGNVENDITISYDTDTEIQGRDFRDCFHNYSLIQFEHDPFAILRTLGTRIIPIQGSCGASLNGEFWIIGGWNEGRQVFITVNRVTI